MLWGGGVHLYGVDIDVVPVVVVGLRLRLGGGRGHGLDGRRLGAVVVLDLRITP